MGEFGEFLAASFEGLKKKFSVKSRFSKEDHTREKQIPLGC